jgi:MFS family permease
VVGRWIDTRGPRSAILVGALLTAGSYALMSTTSSLWQWYVYSAINSTFRTMMFFLPFQSLVSRFFDRRRGIALGILGTGFSLGGLAVVPGVAVMINQLGWDGSFLVSAAVIVAVFVPIGLLVVRNSPAEVGQFPDGAKYAAGVVPAAPTGLTLAVAIRTPNFWVLAAAVTLFFFGMFGWMIHQVPFYESVGISTTTGSLIVSASAGLGIFTRLIFGFFADRIRSMELAALGLAAFLFGGMATLSITTGPVGIVLFLGFWVVGAGGGPMMEALLLTRAFGVKHFATIFGVFLVVETLGQVLSPVLAGAIFDASGTYDAVLMMWMGTFAASVALFLVASRLPRPYTAPAPGRTEAATQGGAA